MKIEGEFQVPEFDLAKYTREVATYLEGFFKAAIREWITAVTGRVPIWSGMARASLINIARLVNGKVVLGPLQDKSRIPQGEALGTAQLIANFPNYVFDVTIEVPHYVIQEDTNVRASTGRGSPSAPWHSFQAGEAAFNEFVKGIKIPLPKFTAKVIRIS